MYVVWFNVLWSDSKSRWDPTLFTDKRVTQFWDDRRVTGDWFERNVVQGSGFAWDAYFLYGSSARWRTVPAPLIAAGSPVIAGRKVLALRLLGDQ